MYLQGIEPTARLQLLALCLASLEKQISRLHDENIRYNPKAFHALYLVTGCSGGAWQSSQLHDFQCTCVMWDVR